jgi:2-polyprenyl-3-methyl-5-hydroxy-6-metoxy-1,4-benzoquinol methylase
VDSNYHNTRLKRDPKESLVWKAIVDHLHSKVLTQPIRSSLDLGCGYGDFSKHLKAEQKTAIDLEDLSEHQSSNVNFIQGSALKSLERLDPSFDLCFSSNLIEHLSQDEGHELIHTIWKKLKPGGMLLLLQPNFRFCYRRYFDDYTHKTIYTDEGLSGLLQSQGFHVTIFKPRFLPFSMRGSLLPKTYGLTKLYLDLGSPILGAQMLIGGIKPKA